MMKAIHLVKYGNPSKAFEIREVPIPEPTEGQVQIKVHSFGLNFADVVARNGLYPDAPKNPAVIGYDVAGTITKLGKGVTKFNVGDQVTALTRFGGYAEYAVTMQEGVAKIPNGYDIGLSTALATQGCTAYYCAKHCVNLKKGDRVLVQAAAGGVGSIITQIAKSKGCEVFGTASTAKLDFIRSNGVDHPIDYRKENFHDSVKSILGDNKLDYVFDSIGGKAFRQGYKLLIQGGTMVSFGAASQIGGSKLKALGAALGFGVFSPIQLLLASKSIIAVNMQCIGDFKPHLFADIFDGVIHDTEQGIIRPVLAKTFSASEIAEAHSFIESRQSIGKIVLEW